MFSLLLVSKGLGCNVYCINSHLKKNMNHQEKQGADLESVLLKAILKLVCIKSKKLKYSVSTSSEFKKKIQHS